MTANITRISEAFSRHSFDETHDHMLDDIEWTVVGGRTITGKADVAAACRESMSELVNVTTTFHAFKVVTADNCVVIDSRAEYVDADGEVSLVASCDIYDFIDERLAAITSYMLKL